MLCHVGLTQLVLDYTRCSTFLCGNTQYTHTRPDLGPLSQYWVNWSIIIMLCWRHIESFSIWALAHNWITNLQCNVDIYNYILKNYPPFTTHSCELQLTASWHWLYYWNFLLFHDFELISNLHFAFLQPSEEFIPCCSWNEPCNTLILSNRPGCLTHNTLCNDTGSPNQHGVQRKAW